MAKFFKKPRWTTPVFYGVLLIVIIAFFLFMSGLMDKLNIHLEKYQASHINTQYRKVFDQHFSQPDWGKLYGEAGLEDTPYESAFAGYKDWFIKVFRRPGYTIEVGSGTNPLPLSQFDQIYRENLGILVTAAGEQIPS